VSRILFDHTVPSPVVVVMVVVSMLAMFRGIALATIGLAAVVASTRTRSYGVFMAQIY
jgi:hypothetical protein